ncbi:hypothetical protein [Ktedonospora formicarum]|uniref:Uncharacterized protein n=1 Tax=Ktedonospora formicarum TaxID=2778364 RepID=A0A8J3HUM1_9CHLR|nr:hypothetical protein [Ktedonospora formicarum]GHO43581.1 hypothetical protein KSX_17440 [Ktedonospora formicarum]
MRSNKDSDLYKVLQILTHNPLIRWRIQCYICIFLLGWLFATLLEHLLWFSLSMPFSLTQLGLPLLLLGAAHLTLFPELASPVGHSSWQEQTRLLLINIAFVLVVLPAFLAFLPFQIPSFTWSWPMTIILALGTTFFTLHLLHKPRQRTVWYN